MASAGKYQTIDSTGEVIFSSTADGGACSGFVIGCHPDSENNIEVNIVGLHKTGEYFPIYIGGYERFNLSENGITSVFARSATGNAIIDYGVTLKV